MTFSAFNILSVGKLLEWVDTQPFGHVYFNLMHDPKHFNMKVLPDEAKEKIATKILRETTNTKYYENIKNLCNFLLQKDQEIEDNKDKYWADFKRHLLQTDKFRVVDNGASADLIAADDGGAATLFYSGSAKVATTLTGAKTTGVSSCTSHCMPTADVGGDLGSTTNRWANVYTADMQLSNEGSQNDIDGTWGSYTIQEGESDLFLINKRNGKKYKFNLTEVS